MLWENVRIALKAIRANKMRSVLTTLGIIIGVAAVIGVVSIVQGLDRTISDQLSSVGGTYVMVFPFQDPNDPDAADREPLLTYQDGLAVLEQASAVSYVSPIFEKGARVVHRDRKDSIQLVGVGQSYQEVSNHWVAKGRFFSALDLDRRAPVCLLGQDLVGTLALGDTALGTEIVVDGQPCTIIGILEKKGQVLGENRDKMVLIPITTAEDRYGTLVAHALRLDFQARSAEDADLAKDQIESVLRKRHRIPEGKKDDFQVLLQEEMLKATGKILGTVTWVVAAVVGISLMVGGIGIMNVMLVSVTERTREIGIRKAVGARRSDILVQFLLESVTLSVFGGSIGVALGTVLGIVGAKLIPGDFPAAHVPAWAVALAFGFSGLVGVVFGTYPAAKAASLDPIESLRYE